MKPFVSASLAALIIMTASAQSPDNLPKPGDRPNVPCFDRSSTYSPFRKFLLLRGPRR